MKFMVDSMLGKLARYLRMCGYDAAYAPDRGVDHDDAILALTSRENRTLLTRDRALAARADDAILIKPMDITDQLRALESAGIPLSLTEPTRCGRCNAVLERVTDGPTPGYAPEVAETLVWRCSDCGQYFWRGSHWADVQERLQSL